MKKLSKIADILVRRDGMTYAEAEDMIAVAKEELKELVEAGQFESAFNICEEHFGLEPDYLYELMSGLGMPF